MAESNKNKTREKNTTKLNLMDLLIPVVSGVVFILVLFFVLIPSINNSNDMLLEIEQIQKDQEVLERNLETVRGLDFAVLQSDLSNARRVLPRRLEVAQFAYYVNSLSREKDLSFGELKVHDMPVTIESVLDVEGVRATMDYSGDYNDILDFFNELQLVSPYVISFGHKVELTKRGAEVERNVNWRLEIDITGYYTKEREVAEATINPLIPFTPYDAYEEMVAEFADRVERLLED